MLKRSGQARSEVSIFGADQKDRNLWERECSDWGMSLGFASTEERNFKVL